MGKLTKWIIALKIPIIWYFIKIKNLVVEYFCAFFSVKRINSRDFYLIFAILAVGKSGKKWAWVSVNLLVQSKIFKLRLWHFLWDNSLRLTQMPSFAHNYKKIKNQKKISEYVSDGECGRLIWWSQEPRQVPKNESGLRERSSLKGDWPKYKGDIFFLASLTHWLLKLECSRWP